MKTLIPRLLVVCSLLVVSTASFAEEKFLTLAYAKPVVQRSYWKTLAEMHSGEVFSIDRDLFYKSRAVVPERFWFNTKKYTLPGEKFMFFDSFVYQSGGKFGEDFFSCTPFRRSYLFGGVSVFSRYPLQVSGRQPDEIAIALSATWKFR